LQVVTAGNNSTITRNSLQSNASIRLWNGDIA
jgi:hypothetical protein